MVSEHSDATGDTTALALKILVAGGFGVTTIPALMATVLPPGLSLLHVDAAPAEIRRILLARLPGRPAPAISAVARAITAAVARAETVPGARAVRPDGPAG